MSRFYRRINDVLGIQPEEVPTFWIITLLFFSLRFSAIFLTNHAETAFLKRYGVEHLPEVFLVNGIISFFIVTFVGLLVRPFPLSRVLAIVIGGCGGLVLGIRALMPSTGPWVYPVLYILKAQIPAIYLMLFWNLCNDLFHTRQAKRVFPLILAGGALGIVLGSILTAPIAKTRGMDDLLTVYGVLMVSIGGVISLFLRGQRRLPAELPAGQIRRRAEPLQDLLRTLRQISRHPLVRVLIVLTVIPNLTLPLLNFQFSFILDGTYAAESALLQFYAWFRAAFHLLNFVLLLITPRIYQRLGIPNSLLFHPLNYVLVFALLLSSFSLPAAIYARVSTSLFRYTLNNPGRGILVGLLPQDLRGSIRPVLRGTVTRTGALLGSLILILSRDLFSPQHLCWIGICLTGIWVVVAFRLKKRYGSYLVGSLERSHIDVRVMEEDEVRILLQDASAMKVLMEHIRGEDGQRCSFFAALLARTGQRTLTELVLEVLPDKDPSCQTALIEMLPAPLGDEFADRLVSLAHRVAPEALPALVRRVSEQGCHRHQSFLRSMIEYRDPRVRMEANAGLYLCAVPPERDLLKERMLIRLQNKQGPPSVWFVEALGRTGDPLWVPWLKRWINQETEESVVISCIKAVCQLCEPDEALPLLETAVKDSRAAVRETCLKHLPDGAVEDLFWSSLKDPDPHVRRVARGRLVEREKIQELKFLRGISHPLPLVRREVILIAEKVSPASRALRLGILKSMRRAYHLDEDIQVLETLPYNPGQPLLFRHLKELRWLEIETGLLLSGLQDPERKIWTLVDELQSTDPRMRSNALEALEYLLPREMGRVWVPLLDVAQRDQRKRVAKEVLKSEPLREEPHTAFLDRLSGELSPIGQAALLWMLGRLPVEAAILHIVERGLTSPHSVVSETARHVLDVDSAGEGDGERNKTMMTTIEKVIYLKEVELFEDLTIEELATIASVAREEEYSEGEILFREGDPGGSFFLVVQGEVEAIKGYGEPGEFHFRRVIPNGNFGCMSIFDRLPRAATARTVKLTHLLVIDRQSLLDILMELPSISVKINAALSRRVRRLLEQPHVELHDEMVLGSEDRGD